MGLRNRLRWVHKTFEPEVFLRTVALIQGQHSGGLGYADLSHTSFDIIVPPYAIGINDRVTGSDREDLPSLQEAADALAKWMKTGREVDLDVHGLPVRSPHFTASSLPDDSPYARHINWIVKIIRREMATRDRYHAMNGGEMGPHYYRSEGRSGPGYEPPRWQPDRYLHSIKDLLGRFAPDHRFLGREFSTDVVTTQDIVFAKTMTLLSQHMGRITDWVDSSPGEDLGRYDLHSAINEQNVWHARLAEEMKGRAARLAPGKVLRRWTDGWTLQNLLTKDRLVAEGKSMGHCVGESSIYLRGVQRGEMAILSLRDPEGDPHVTVELLLAEQHTESSEYVTVLPDGETLQILDYSIVAQAKGFEDRPPTHETAPYLKEFLSEVIAPHDWGEASFAMSPRSALLGVEKITDFSQRIDLAYELGTPSVCKADLLGQIQRAKDSDQYEDLVKVYGLLTVMAVASPQASRAQRQLDAYLDGRLSLCLRNEPDWFDEVMGEVTSMPRPSRLL